MTSKLIFMCKNDGLSQNKELVSTNKQSDFVNLSYHSDSAVKQKKI